MRPIIAACLLLVGCASRGDDDGYPVGGGGPGVDEGCSSDADCGAAVCARDGECLPAVDLRQATVKWTINGAAASATTCANGPKLEIDFDADAQLGSFGFAPVPCAQGQFNIDKLPVFYTSVSIGTVDANEYETSIVTNPIGSDGTIATFDLAL